MSLAIVTIEHGPHAEVLTQPAAKVTFPLSTENQILISHMKEMVLEIKGVGLAAPQIGVSKQIIVYTISEDAKCMRNNATDIIPVTVLINPQYTPMPDAKFAYDWEGCFSVNETTGKVPRYDKISYSAQDIDGQIINGTATGFTARVLQHEIDHIHGILIINRLTPDCIQGHPNDMMFLRYQELNKEQKTLMKKMILQREKSINPNDTDRVLAVLKLKKLIEDDEKQ